MSLRERINKILGQKSIDEMLHLAAAGIDSGGSFNIEVGKGEERRFLDINSVNKTETFPKLFQILTNPEFTGKTIKFTLLNRDRQITNEFTSRLDPRG